MPSDDPAAHNINDNPATHDVNDDPIARAGFVSNDRDAGTAAPGLPHTYTGPVVGLQHEYIGITSDHLTGPVTV